jgi:hypothetical protein
VINVVVQLTIAAWLALEAGLIIRDRVRGKGSAARDRGTLWLNIIIITAAVVAAGILTDVLQNAAAWQFGSTGLSVAGLRRPHEAARAGVVVNRTAGRGASEDAGRAGSREGRLADIATGRAGHVLPRGARPAVSRATLSLLLHWLIYWPT